MIKKLLPLALLFTIGAAFSGAQDLYVSSRVGALLSNPDPTARRVAVLRQGDALTVIEEADNWYQVEAPRGTGYIQARFVSDNEPTRRVSGGGLQDISAVSTRRRASAYTTSAAATRGLSADNPRQRQSLSFSEYDFKSVDWVKSFNFEDQELIEFAQQERIGL